MDKFKTKLPRDDLKRLAKDVSVAGKPNIKYSLIMLPQISKKIVNSDFKNRRVEDPTRISSRQEKQVKKHVKEFFDKAVLKKQEYDKRKAARKQTEADAPTPIEAAADVDIKDEESDLDPEMELSDEEAQKRKQETETPVTPMDRGMSDDRLKRKREEANGSHQARSEEDDSTPSKRMRSETPPTPPPPPPPPPVESKPPDQSPPLDLVMANSLEEGGYTDHDGGGFHVRIDDVMENTTPIKEPQAMDFDAAPPPAFNLTRPGSEIVDTSDSAPSPTILDPSDMTSIESDGEGMDRREQSYAGLNLKGVQALEVRDGS